MLYLNFKCVVLSVCVSGLWRAGPLREPFPHHRGSVRRRRAGLGIRHSAVLADGLHLGGGAGPGHAGEGDHHDVDAVGEFAHQEEGSIRSWLNCTVE